MLVCLGGVPDIFAGDYNRRYWMMDLGRSRSSYRYRILDAIVDCLLIAAAVHAACSTAALLAAGGQTTEGP